MKNVLAAVLLALPSSVALSGEVGALNPQAEYPASLLELALADTGASYSWAVLPYTTDATAHQMADLKTQIDAINQSMNTTLEAAIEQKLLSSLTY